MIFFKQYLMEFPYVDATDYSVTPTNAKGIYKPKYSPTFHKEMLGERFSSLGKGSSRIAFECNVPVTLFSHKDQQEHELQSESISTVIKLATSNKGVQQNTVELKTWLELQGSLYDKFLCPILDWSGNPEYNNNTQYTLDIGSFNIDIHSDQTGAFWIQMPKVIPAKKAKKQFMELYNNTFGFTNSNPNSLKDFDLYELRAIQSMQAIQTSGMRQRYQDAGDVTDEQEENFDDLVDMCASYDVGDVGTLDNWGIYKNRPLLLDYGYNRQTRDIYWDKKNTSFSVYINPSGEVKIRFQKHKINYR